MVTKRLREFMRRFVRRNAGHAALFDVLAAQLREACRQMEQGVVGVCADFRGMTERARETVRTASHTLEGADLIATSRRTLGSLLERLERGSDLSRHAISHMNDVELGMGRIQSALVDIQQIVFANRLLALNAKIQAVHVGAAGAAFGVVADELSEQARRSGEKAEEISQTVQDLLEAMRRTAEDLREMAAAEQERTAVSRREVEQALDGIERIHGEMGGAIAEAARKGEQLAGNISKAVVELQFQDRVSQRIDHVVEALEAMRSGVSEDVLAGLEKRYSMETEREVLARETGQSFTVSTAGEVELF